jgi:HK97 family phage major capsid protein
MTAIKDMSHGQTVARLNAIRESLEEMESRDELTAEDERSFDELTQEFAEVDTHRRQLERRSALERVRSATKVSERGPAAVKIAKGSDDGYDLDPVLNPDSVEDCRFRNPWDVDNVRTFGRSKDAVKAEFRARALSAIEKMSGASDKIRSTATEFVERHDDANGTMARLALATSAPEYIRGWAKVASGRSHLVTQDEQRALERAMSLTDAQGGYLVPFQLDPTVILTSDGSANQIRQIARRVVATGDVWHGVSAGAVQWGWLSEAGEASDNSPTFAQPSITVHKAAGFVPISFEALDDAANVTQEVGRLLAQGKDDLEAVAFISGTGVGQPKGLITALDAAGTSDVAAGTADTLAADDIYALDNDLPARYRGNASWLGNRTTYNQIRALDSTGGGQMWERIGNGMPSNLLGRPVYEAEAMAKADTSVGATDSVLVYGDFESFVVVDRVGMTVEFIPNLMGSGGRPTGQRGWFAHYRVGSDVVNPGGLRQLKA